MTPVQGERSLTLAPDGRTGHPAGGYHRTPRADRLNRVGIPGYHKYEPMRGRMITVLRESVGAVPESALSRVVDDAAQGARCLQSLLADGLVVRIGADLVDLPA